MNDPELNRNIATILISTINIIRLLKIREMFSSNIDERELKHLLGVLNAKISTNLNHPIWKNYKEDFYFVPYDTLHIPQVLSRLVGEAYTFFEKNDEIQAEQEVDSLKKIEEYCEEDINSINERITDIWIFDCRFPDENANDEYKSINRYFFLLTKYWEVYRHLLEVCGAALFGVRPHPLGRIINNLIFRIEVCLEKLSNDELNNAFSYIRSLNPVESDDFTIDWECGGISIANKIDNAIESQTLHFGKRIVALTEQENSFLSICNLRIENFEQRSTENAKAIIKKISEDQSLKQNFFHQGRGIEIEKYSNIKIEEVIKRGEGETIEFKETFQFDVRAGQLNSSLRKEVVEAVAAFMNSKGGILLIGVHDNQNITGLEPDYSVLNKKNQDGFQQTLCQELENRIKPENFCYLSINILNIEDRELCRIDIAEAKEPIYVYDKEKKAYFFIRRGNSVKELNVQEALKYIKSRWPGL